MSTDRTIEVLQEVKKALSQYPERRETCALLEATIENLGEAERPFQAIVKLSQMYDELPAKSEDQTHVGIILDTLVATRIDRELGADGAELSMTTKRALFLARENGFCAMSLGNGESLETERDANTIIDEVFKRPRDAGDDLLDRVFRRGGARGKPVYQNQH